MDGDWIKIDRKILYWQWFEIPEMVQLWIYLLAKANWNDGKWQNIVVKRGQLVTGRQRIASDLRMSEQTVRTCLKRLESTNEITIEPTNKYSIITICNYDSYQDYFSATNQQANQQNNHQLTNNQPTTNQQLTTIEESKKERIDSKENDSPTGESQKKDNLSFDKAPKKKGSTVVRVSEDVGEDGTIEELKSGEKIRYKDLIKTFNEMFDGILVSVKVLNDSRRKAVRARANEYGKQSIMEVFRKVKQSTYLQGNNKDNWKATFDWIFTAKYYPRILEGNYDDINCNTEQTSKLGAKQQDASRRQSNQLANLAAIQEEWERNNSGREESS